MIRRLALALGLVTVVSITAGAAAVLPIGDSAPLQVIDTDVPPIVPTTSTPTTPPDEPEHGHKVWVCVVLVDHHGERSLKPGKNPIEVAATSANARDALDPDHPSYVAADADEECRLP